MAIFTECFAVSWTTGRLPSGLKVMEICEQLSCFVIIRILMKRMNAGCWSLSKVKNCSWLLQHTDHFQIEHYLRYWQSMIDETCDGNVLFHWRINCITRLLKSSSASEFLQKYLRGYGMQWLVQHTFQSVPDREDYALVKTRQACSLLRSIQLGKVNKVWI